MPENLSTLEELSDILDAIFRQRESLTAVEAFIEYWDMSYSRMQVPKQGWPPAIRHCLSSVGLLPEETEKEEEESILEPLPHIPLAISFTTPPAVRCDTFTSIQSPQRPQKIFGPFPIIPSSPMSPLLRRTPLSSIQLCKTPQKRRRLSNDHEDGNDGKENVVVDRVAGAAKKRRCGEMENEVEKQRSGPSAKKLKSSMRPRTRSTSKKASQHVSPTSSVASSKESEDERQWVEATLRIPFPVMGADDACQCGGGFSARVPSSLDGSGVNDNLSSSSRTLDTRKRPMRLRRSVSIPESMLRSKTEKKRKRQERDAGDSDDDYPDLYDLDGSYPLPAPHLSLPPPSVRRLRKAYTLPSSDSDVSSNSMSSSSDDDPYIGQVTPHHLISPILQRRTKVVDSSLTSQTWTPLGMGPGFGERCGDSMIPGSDDSVTTSGSETESPTKATKARQMKIKIRTLKS